MVDPDLYDEFIACNRSTDFFPYSIFQRLTWLASWPRDVVLEVQKICANEVCPRKMTAAHSGFKCCKLARNSFLQLFKCDFTNVICSKAIFSISVSGTRMNFIFKVVKLLQVDVWSTNFMNSSIQFSADFWNLSQLYDAGQAKGSCPANLPFVSYSSLLTQLTEVRN